MRRFAIILLAFILMIMLCACGPEGDNTPVNSQDGAAGATLPTDDPAVTTPPETSADDTGVTSGTVETSETEASEPTEPEITTTATEQAAGAATTTSATTAKTSTTTNKATEAVTTVQTTTVKESETAAPTSAADPVEEEEEAVGGGDEITNMDEFLASLGIVEGGEINGGD